MHQKGETALVTGASSGIGRETAIRLARAGFKVLALARREERLSELAREDERVIPRVVDLSSTEAVEKFCGELAGLKEPVSILINNAGYSIRGTLEDVSLEVARRLFEVNLFALIRITQAVLPGMRKQRKGTIVNLSSIVGKFTFPTSGVYAASKHAVEAISDALRLEVAPFGIRVITLRPGPIASEFNEAATRLTGDLMARTDPDYQALYQAYGAGMGKLFSGLTIPGPEIIAETIMEAVLSENPQVVYARGPLSEEILPARRNLDDGAFHTMMAEKTGLLGLKL
jgi:short-subunit dehydrogenase